MQKGLKEAIKGLFPILNFSRHKGQCGRIGIIGGSKEYTGAPYFAGMAALKLGADLIHIICPESAAPVIKAYSPELIVHPLLGEPDSIPEIRSWLQRFHSVVIGPGLGRSVEGSLTFKSLINEVRELNIPLVLDADALYYVTEDVSLLVGLKRTVLTPNVVEFSRLATAAGLEGDSISVQELAKKLGNVTIVRKGQIDEISNGIESMPAHVVDLKGSPRRCGGQGDLLSGTLGLLLHWSLTDPSSANSIDTSPITLAAQTACVFTRLANRRAFEEKFLSATTTDMLELSHNVAKELCIGSWDDSLIQRKSD